MKIESKNIVDQPIDVVFELLKNNISDLVHYLPNISSIKEVSRKTEGNTEYVTSTWTANAELPSILKKLAKPELLSWNDIAEWDLDSKTVTYNLESKLASDLYTAKGKNTLTVLDDNKTEMFFSCEVTPHPENFPGVPKFLAKKIVPALEGLLKLLLEPNFKSMNKGIEEYFKNK